MASAVEADLAQLKVVFAVYRRMDRAIDPSEIAEEDRRAPARRTRLPPRGRAHRPLPRHAGRHPANPRARSLPRALDRTPADDELAEGRTLLEFKTARSTTATISRRLFRAWWYPVQPLRRHPRRPASRQLHGVRERGLRINLLDYGCIRTFKPKFVGGVIDLYRALERNDRDLAVHAYETWGFNGLKKEVIETLNIWARFIYAPMLDNRVRTVAKARRPASTDERKRSGAPDPAAKSAP